jgi:hypothetical protein
MLVKVYLGLVNKAIESKCSNVALLWTICKNLNKKGGGWADEEEVIRLFPKSLRILRTCSKDKRFFKKVTIKKGRRHLYYQNQHTVLKKLEVDEWESHEYPEFVLQDARLFKAIASIDGFPSSQFSGPLSNAAVAKRLKKSIRTLQRWRWLLLQAGLLETCENLAKVKIVLQDYEISKRQQRECKAKAEYEKRCEESEAYWDKPILERNKIRGYATIPISVIESVHFKKKLELTGITVNGTKKMPHQVVWRETEEGQPFSPFWQLPNSYCSPWNTFTPSKRQRRYFKRHGHYHYHSARLKETWHGETNVYVDWALAKREDIQGKESSDTIGYYEKTEGKTTSGAQIWEPRFIHQRYGWDPYAVFALKKK